VHRPDAKNSSGTGTELASVCKQIETVKQLEDELSTALTERCECSGCPFARNKIGVAECVGQTLGGEIPRRLMPVEGIMKCHNVYQTLAPAPLNLHHVNALETKPNSLLS
jgi:hypothetical protein